MVQEEPTVTAADKRKVSFRITTSSEDSKKNSDDRKNQTTLSERSTGGSSTGSQSSVSIPSLGERLIRTQKHRDPLRYYEIIQLLGDGSMGSVCKVRKKTFGGSARKHFVQDEKAHHGRFRGCFPCFLFCSPGQSSGSGGSGGSKSFVTVENSSGATKSTVSTVPTESSYDTEDDDKKDNQIMSGHSPWFLFGFSGQSDYGGDSTNKSNVPSIVPTDSSHDDDEDLDNSPRNKVSKWSSQRKEQYGVQKKTSSMISYGTEVSVDFALKTIILDQCRNDAYKRELMNEIAVLRSLDHPNIVRAIETYDYRNLLYLVLELCNGGDLYTRDPYTESQACAITYSLLDAIAYLHSKNITHRDLKYENIMFASPTSSTVKIIDFGLSKKYGKTEEDDSSNNNNTMNETVGTIYTMAPEVLKGDYDEKCDCWSIGILAFMLVSSSVPFYGKTRSDIEKKILRGKWEFKGREWKRKSREAKDFMRTMLVQNVAKRPSATEAMEHVWFDNIQHSEDHHGDDGPISNDVMDRVVATIRAFAGYSRLKQLALLVVAHQSIDEEIGYLRRLFLQRFDTDKASPNFSYPEFKQALTDYDYSNEEFVDMFSGIDIDGTGKISFTEFLAASIEARGSIEEERIAEAFDRIDCDDSGYITVHNLKDILGNEVGEGFLHEIIEEDKTGVDHHISYEDFLGLWDSECDEKLRLALLDVQQRRRLHGGAPLQPAATFSDSMYDNYTGSMNSDRSGYDGDTEVGTGHSFFDREKAKSIRGAWI